MKLYEGRFAANHFELSLVCIRRDRTMRQQRRVPEWCLEEWRQETLEHVSRQVRHPAQNLLVSAESLSLLRYEDEVAALRDALSPRELRVAVCLREKQSYLDSLRREMWRDEIAPSRYHTSHNYIESDTWLVEWDHMLSVWRTVLGEDNVVAFGYEEAMARHRSTIPAVLGALHLDADGLPSWERLTANVTSRLSKGAPGPLKRLSVTALRRMAQPKSPSI